MDAGREPEPDDRAHRVAGHEQVGDRRSVEQELGRGPIDARAPVAHGHRDREHVAVAERCAVGGLRRAEGGGRRVGHREGRAAGRAVAGMVEERPRERVGARGKGARRASTRATARQRQRHGDAVDLRRHRPHPARAVADLELDGGLRLDRDGRGREHPRSRRRDVDVDGERQVGRPHAGRVVAAHRSRVDAVAERRGAEAQARLRRRDAQLVLTARARRDPEVRDVPPVEPQSAEPRLRVGERERAAHVAVVPDVVEQAPAIDPGEARRDGVVDDHLHAHQRDVVVPRVGHDAARRRVRVERDADLAEAARERDRVIGQRDRLLLGDEHRRGIPGLRIRAHLHAREELGVAHARAVGQRAADDRGAGRRRPLPARLPPERLGGARARHHAIRGEIGTAARGGRPAEHEPGLGVSAPAREVAREVVGDPVLAGVRAGGTAEGDQERCEQRQEANAWHSASFVTGMVTCLSRSVPNACHARLRRLTRCRCRCGSGRSGSPRRDPRSARGASGPARRAPRPPARE